MPLQSVFSLQKFSCTLRICALSCIKLYFNKMFFLKNYMSRQIPVERPSEQLLSSYSAPSRRRQAAEPQSSFKSETHYLKNNFPLDRLINHGVLHNRWQERSSSLRTDVDKSSRCDVEGKSKGQSQVDARELFLLLKKERRKECVLFRLYMHGYTWNRAQETDTFAYLWKGKFWGDEPGLRKRGFFPWYPLS